jgi:hypothetical protein
MQIEITETPPSFNLELDYYVESTLKSFKEEVFDSLYEQHKKHNVERLLLSDGMDSSFIALCLQEIGIPFKPLSFIFSKKQNHVTKEIINFCKANAFIPSFFLIEKELFFKHVEYLTYEKKIAYPVLNGYYVDYMLNNFQENFFSGMSVEFKYYNNSYISLGMVGPYLVKRNNPNRLFGFASSRTFLAYINNPVFQANYKIDLSKLERDDEYYIRDLIYTSIFPNLNIKRKTSWDDNHITIKFEKEYLPKIKKEVPWVFELKNYKFYVDQYFKKD